MKFIKITKKTTLLVAIMVTIFGCTLSDIDVPKISQDNVVKDEKSAQALLNGAYSQFRMRRSTSYMAEYTTKLLLCSPYNEAGPYISYVNPKDYIDFMTNNLKSNSKGIGTFIYFYESMYSIIDNVNELIANLESKSAKELKMTSERKNEFIGEAKGLRALCHFMLLRTFGEFYDLNSPYGIVIANKVLTAEDKLPRNTVKEVYDFIEKDLLFASKNSIPTTAKRVYISKDVAKAFLAKIYLYMGKYAEAITVSEPLIKDKSNYGLESDYASVFTKRWDSPEVLFSLFTGSIKEAGVNDLASLGHTDYITFSGIYYSIPNVINNLGTAFADERPLFITNPAGLGLSLGLSNKYPFSTKSSLGIGNTYYFMRMAEVYLIYAEAKARLDDTDEALKTLNEVRKRSNPTERTFSDKNTLLKDIREEKLLELTYETGETWFDLVRCDRLGDIVLGALKPTLAKDPTNPTETNSHKLIFPIPKKIMDGNYKLKQNPEYH